MTDIKSIWSSLKKSPNFWIVFWIILVTLIWSISWWLITRFGGFCEEQAGSFGDSFGAVNALFTGLAFAVLIYTIYQQQRQFSLERFETNFFQLLEDHNKSRDSLEYYPPDSNKRKGSRVFQDFEDTRQYGIFEHQESRNEIQIFVEKRSYCGNLYVYFRTLESLIKYIDKSSIGDKEFKDFYIRIIYSQRLVREQTTLLLYGLTTYGKEMKKLINDYYFLRDYPRNFPVPLWIEKEYLNGFKNPPFIAREYFNETLFYAKLKQKQEMLDSLSKACELDNEFRQKAKTTKTFSKYWDDADFKKIVGE
jgi:hypothetical protein